MGAEYMGTCGEILEIRGYAYSGAGHAVVRVDISINGGETWEQAELTRADAQCQRSGRAWAWVQWKYIAIVPTTSASKLQVFSKAVDDQYNQRPHDTAPIWNLRGILNTSWGK